MAKHYKTVRRDKRDAALLLELTAALGAGNISESYLRDVDNDHVLIHGLCDGGRVKVNPAIGIVDTVLHELLHRIRPTWTERAVRSRTQRLMNTLTHEEVLTIDALYHSVKHVRGRK